MTVIVRTPNSMLPERHYVVDVVCREFLGLAYELICEARDNIEITLVGDSERVVVLDDSFFATASRDWLARSTIPTTPLTRLLQSQLEPLRTSFADLPVLFGHELQGGQWASRNGGMTKLGVDIFGSLFFLLSRYEEVAISTRGEHDWFPAGSSLAVQEEYLTRAVGNEYLELLWNALSSAWPQLRRSDRKYTVRLSHDVDWPLCNAGRGVGAFVRTVAGDVLARKDPGLMLRRLASYPRIVRGSTDCDVCNTFDFIMDESEARGLRSAFYFIAGHSAGRIDGVYDIEAPWVRALLRRIHQRGHEVGIHPSYNTYLWADRVASEFATLRRVCDEEGVVQSTWGGRQHYLRWRAGVTWPAWEGAGIDYDSTVGHAEAMGFRAGVCYEYPVFDLTSRKMLALRERPLVAMEVSALDLMRLTLDEAAEKMISLARVCGKFRGEFTLLWHNNRLVTRREKDAYREVLSAVTSGPSA